VNQVPTPGTPLAVGQPVTVVVAIPQMPEGHVSIPTLVGLPWREAEKILQDRKLGVAWRLITIPEAPEGAVLGQTPLPGSVAPAHAEVVVRVSRSPGTPLPPPPPGASPAGPPPPEIGPPPSSLGAPGLLKPAEGEAFPRAYGATFEWAPVAGAQSYDWELQENRAGEWTTVSLQAVATTRLRPEKMTAGQFRWRVRATAGTVQSGWSAFRTLHMY
jgi:hypothetical protein